MHIHSAFYRCKLPQNLRFKLNLKIHMHWRQNSTWNLLFSYEFLQNEFESQILWQCTSIDAVWISIISIFLNAPRGFSRFHWRCVCTEYFFPMYHICHMWAWVMEEILPTFLDTLICNKLGSWITQVPIKKLRD